jgi:hypothetical protein
MENIVKKFRELGDYMYLVNENKEKEYLIKAILFNDDINYLLYLLKLFRPEDENENQSIIELDENNVEKTVIKYSQVNELINTFGLINNEEVKNKILEYLNDLLLYKNTFL